MVVREQENNRMAMKHPSRREAREHISFTFQDLRLFIMRYDTHMASQASGTALLLTFEQFIA